MSDAPKGQIAYCLKCDYPLAGVSTGAVCPECGRRFDLADAKSFAVRPGARRRRWVRAGKWVLAIVVVYELFAPSRLARMRWSWPNADGVTATTATRWCFAPPRWLPFLPYPRLAAPDAVKAIEPGGLVAHEVQHWRIGYWSVYRNGGAAMSLGSAPGKGPGMGWLGTRDGRGVTIQPENVDRLCDMILEMQREGTPMIFSNFYPPTSPGLPSSTSPEFGSKGEDD